MTKIKDLLDVEKVEKQLIDSMTEEEILNCRNSLSEYYRRKEAIEHRRTRLSETNAQYNSSIANLIEKYNEHAVNLTRLYANTMELQDTTTKVKGILEIHTSKIKNSTYH